MSRGGSSFEGKRTPGSALFHERGGQAGPDEFDAFHMARRCTGRKPRASRTVLHATGALHAPPRRGVNRLGRSRDRKSVVEGKSVDLGGRRILQNKENNDTDFLLESERD